MRVNGRVLQLFHSPGCLQSFGLMQALYLQYMMPNVTAVAVLLEGSLTTVSESRLDVVRRPRRNIAEYGLKIQGAAGAVLSSQTCSRQPVGHHQLACFLTADHRCQQQHKQGPTRWVQATAKEGLYLP